MTLQLPSNAVDGSFTNTTSIVTALVGEQTVQGAPATDVLEIIEHRPGCGDLNDDGLVNVFDAIIDLQIIVGLIEPTEAQLKLGDVVRDGTINVLDAILLLQHIVGLTVITECGP